jgi:hypothetical protein
MTKKTKVKEARFRLDPYHCEMACHFVYGSLMEYAEHANVEGVDQETGAFFYETHDPYTPVVVIPVADKRINIPLLVHETTHAALAVFARIGQEVDSSKEPFCYLTQHIFTKIMEASKKCRLEFSV